MNYALFLILSVIVFVLVKKKLLKSLIVTLPIILAFLANFFSFMLANVFAEFEFYTLLGFIISQILSSQTIKNLALRQLNPSLEIELIDKRKFIRINSNEKPFIQINKFIFLLFIFQISTALKTVAGFSGMFFLIGSFLINGLQASLVPATFSCLLIVTLSYYVETYIYNLSDKYVNVRLINNNKHE